jgi:hypothetical protein
MADGKKSVKTPSASGQPFILCIRLSAEEHAKLLNMADELGQKNRSKFIRSCIFGREISVVKIDSSLYKVIEWLTKVHSQYRAIGANYNQTVRRINACFGENRAAALLKSLEAHTQNLVVISKQILTVTEKLKERYYGTQNKEKQ